MLYFRRIMGSGADSLPNAAGFTGRFLTATEVARRLRVSKMTVYRLVKGGHLPAVQAESYQRSRIRSSRRVL